MGEGRGTSDGQTAASGHQEEVPEPQREVPGIPPEAAITEAEGHAAYLQGRANVRARRSDHSRPLGGHGVSRGWFWVTHMTMHTRVQRTHVTRPTMALGCSLWQPCAEPLIAVCNPGSGGSLLLVPTWVSPRVPARGWLAPPRRPRSAWLALQPHMHWNRCGVCRAGRPVNLAAQGSCSPASIRTPKGTWEDSAATVGLITQQSRERAVGKSPGLTGTVPPSAGRHKLTISKPNSPIKFLATLVLETSHQCHPF